MIEPIKPISLDLSTPLAAPTNTSFEQFLVNQLADSEQKIEIADESVKQLLVGETDNLHQVMIALGKAKTSFELTVEIRNKLLEGFQEIIKMQI